MIQEELKEAGLRYSTDAKPGITRRRKGKSFEYRLPNGEKADPKTKERIQSLVIPPAWESVWISPDAKGFLQVTARDAKGRKQCRYHPEWRAARETAKFDKLADFAKVLPKIRERVEEDLQGRTLDKNRVLAAVVKLLDETLIRVGNREYARDNGSYGLTTMTTKHMKANSVAIKFQFKGKSGKEHEVTYRDPRLARLIKQIHDLPGQALFQYKSEEGEIVEVTSCDVNDYLRETTQADVTAKDFRTWAATVEAVRLFRDMEDAKPPAVIKEVAKRLGNTPAVCKKSYIHPFVLKGQDWATKSLPRQTKYLDSNERLVEELLK